MSGPDPGTYTDPELNEERLAEIRRIPDPDLRLLRIAAFIRAAQERYDTALVQRNLAAISLLVHDKRKVAHICALIGVTRSTFYEKIKSRAPAKPRLVPDAEKVAADAATRVRYYKAILDDDSHGSATALRYQTLEVLAQSTEDGELQRELADRAGVSRSRVTQAKWSGAEIARFVAERGGSVPDAEIAARRTQLLRTRRGARATA